MGPLNLTTNIKGPAQQPLFWNKAMAHATTEQPLEYYFNFNIHTTTVTTYCGTQRHFLANDAPLSEATRPVRVDRQQSRQSSCFKLIVGVSSRPRNKCTVYRLDNKDLDVQVCMRDLHDHHDSS